MLPKASTVCLLIGLVTGLAGRLPAAELPSNLLALLAKEEALARGRGNRIRSPRARAP